MHRGVHFLEVLFFLFVADSPTVRRGKEFCDALFVTGKHVFVDGDGRHVGCRHGPDVKKTFLSQILQSKRFSGLMQQDFQKMRFGLVADFLFEVFDATFAESHELGLVVSYVEKYSFQPLDV